MEPLFQTPIVKGFYNSIDYTIGYQPVDTEHIRISHRIQRERGQAAISSCEAVQTLTSHRVCSLMHSDRLMIN